METDEEIATTLSVHSRSSNDHPPDNYPDDAIDNDWKLMSELKSRELLKGHQAHMGRKLGVTWTDLTVEGICADTTLNENVLSQWNIPQLIRDGRNPPQKKEILHKSHGCVKPGEMLLVLGRPGAGCTTLLRLLSNRRSGYAGIEGSVSFGSMDHEEARQYSGQIVMNTEEEIFFPTLTVEQTMDFATRLKASYGDASSDLSSEQLRKGDRDFFLRAMEIEHTAGTKVGNEYVRGVSGGERKRVSIAECLSTNGSVFCWDNSTRGLDASTALEYTRAIRAMTDTLGLTTIVTLYQAGNGIFNLFDKVLLLDEGKQIYYGPREQALPFMQNLGFFCDPSANVADFLTGVTVPTERRIIAGYENRFPRTADQILSHYEGSDIKQDMVAEYSYAKSEEARSNTQQFQECVRSEQDKYLPKNSTLTTGFITQIKACVVRQYQVLWGDKPTLVLKQLSLLVLAIILGSLFYNAPGNSSGLFIKGGALFLAVLYPGLMAMSETTDSFTGRPVLAKHRSFAFHNPAAFCLAQIATDIPVILFQITHFSIVLYFMVGLKVSAAAFFVFWFTGVAVAMCMTAFFRMVGAAFPTFDAASKVSGFAIAAFATYVGYMIPKPDMHPWFVWIYWINPLSYGFESLMVNEFHGLSVPCVNNNLVPLGPSYTNSSHQACTGIRGASQGAVSVEGDQYLASLSFNHSHMWRNIGIVWVWWVFYVVLTIIFTSTWKTAENSSRSLLIPREKIRKITRGQAGDEEARVTEKNGHAAGAGHTDQSLVNPNVESDFMQNTSVFTWKNLTYTVKTPEGDRVLLDNIQGWVKPGTLGALMGSSGAGKTTLMDVLAQRKTTGTITGSIMVDGRPLPVSFQRSAGYCEQLDVHESMATVREALEFAALLRQSRDTPVDEKLKYVDTIIDLLELHDIEHTLIGRVGNGLSIEQRKRVTIGVELVSKPGILIFLDEPTSGLDGQAAFSTIRFLRKLAGIGQAILVTIHQPSASLFAQFDTLLLLTRGGKTVYFGDIGPNASTIKEYFGRHGAPCPDESNPAEHMIDVVSGSLSKGKDWHEVWLSSPEYYNTTAELDRIIAHAASKPIGYTDDGHEFAAPLWEQMKIVTHRMNTALYRDIDYVNNRIYLHIGSALFNGFTFWMIGHKVSDLQLRLFTIFNFIFVAPGVFAQLQPLFLERRDIYEIREKKSKTYHWSAFVTGLIISEIPYLLVSGVLYFVCWYYTVGFPTASERAGGTLFVMLMYEFLYTGIGQFVAAYAPNAIFAALVNPLIIGVLVSFCGVLVRYGQMTTFWRYWLYWLNPFNYMMGSMLVFTTHGVEVKCSQSEFAIFDPPTGQSCSQYLSEYMNGAGATSNLVNPDATSGCQVCQYRSGSDYLYSLNLKEYFYGWRDAAIVVIFCISSYALVYGLMKLRTKASKKAEGK